MSVTDRLTRAAAILATLVVAVSSAALSYQGLVGLGRSAGLGELSPLFPVVVDGTVCLGMIGVLHATTTRISTTTYSWALVLLGLGVSVWGNQVGVTSPTGKVVHSIAPVFLALSLEGLLATLRRKVVSEQERAEQAAQEAEAEAARAIKEQERQQRAERLATQPAKPPKPRQTASQPASRPQGRVIDPELAAQIYDLVENRKMVYREVEELGLCSRSSVKGYVDAHKKTLTQTTDEEAA